MWCRLTVFAPDGSPLREYTLTGTGAPDLGVVDQVARLRLFATRVGGTVELVDVSPTLVELLELVGLRDLLGQVRREPEDREDPLGVEE